MKYGCTVSSGPRLWHLCQIVQVTISAKYVTAAVEKIQFQMIEMSWDFSTSRTLLGLTLHGLDARALFAITNDYLLNVGGGHTMAKPNCLNVTSYEAYT